MAVAAAEAQRAAMVAKAASRAATEAEAMPVAGPKAAAMEPGRAERVATVVAVRRRRWCTWRPRPEAEAEEA